MDLPAWLTGNRDGKELKELSEQVKSAKTLVELAWNIGKAVVQAGYEKHQADRACAGYLHSYEQRHGQVKILGMTQPVELESIYTEVQIVPPSFLYGYRSQRELHELFAKRDRSLASNSGIRLRPQPGIEVANNDKYRFLNILGAPGAGKSTFLRYIGLKALQSYRHSITSQLMTEPAALPYNFNLLPVLLELRNLRATSVDFLALVDHELQTNGFPSNFGRAALRAGGLLVLLDGLDEVPANKIDDTIQGIHDLVDQHAGCRYITSCRTAFYKDYFSRFTDVLLTDFSNKQVKNLIENWFRSDHNRGELTATKLWNVLRRVEHRATLELARTPLLATFLCLVFEESQQLPTNRADLYDRALRILLERWAASKRVHGGDVFPGLSTRRELLMLEQIAGPAYANERYFFTGRELATAIEGFMRSGAGASGDVDGRKVVEEIETRQGLLVQHAHDRYSFSHLTLHEYLAACHYYKSGRSREIVVDRLTDPRWREVLLLLAGLQEPDADAILLAMANATANRLRSPALAELFNWADLITRRGDRSPQANLARRFVVMGVAIIVTQARMGASKLTFRHGSAVPHSLGIVRDLGYDIASERAQIISLDRMHVLAKSHAYGNAYSRLRQLGRDLVAYEVVTDKYADRLNQMTEGSQVTPTSPSVLEIRECAADLFQNIMSALEIPLRGKELSVPDMEQWTKLLGCTQRIFECRTAAERVTQTTWDQVCDMLFVPPVRSASSREP